ncbi:MAG: hypothetical protein Pars92KO_15920 [Parasphingorhabdus sp.]
MTLLPRKAYVEMSWQKREKSKIFSNSWSFAALGSHLPKEGDFRALMCGDYPLLVLRLADGSLAGYHNVCRHRGTLLVEGGEGNIGKAMICPYHRWTYSLNGQLRGAPNMSSCFPDMDRSKMGLKPASVGVFQDMIFVHPDPQADFESWIAPIADKAWPHDLSASDLRESKSLTYDMKCNWKVFVENAIDGYHLAYLHENTLGGPTPDENIWERYGDHMIWYAMDEEGVRHSLPAKIRKEFADWWSKPVKSAENIEFGGVYFLFPNILITATPYSFSLSWLEPVSPSRSLLHVRHWAGTGQSRDERKFIPGYNGDSDIISSDNWKQHPLETGDFQTEDVWICERNQRGLESPAFEIGALAEGPGAEEPIRWFHETLAEAMSL